MGKTPAAPRAVFFDVGGTLLTARGSVGEIYSRVLARFGRRLDPEALQERFERSWAEATRLALAGGERFSSAPGGGLGFWRTTLDGHMTGMGEPPLTEPEFAAVYDAFCNADAYDVFEDTIPVLEAVRERGHVVGVISNWDDRLPALLDTLGLSRYFDVTVVSGCERCEKPSPEIFARACERASVAAGAALHVGDSAHDDYHGARAAGLQALLLDRRRLTGGDDVIHGLEAVLDRLGSG